MGAIPQASPSDPMPPAPSGVPPKVQALMQLGGIYEHEIRHVWSSKGYFPYDTPWDVLEKEGFVDGWILPFWEQIVQTIYQDRENEQNSDLPFTM